VQFVESYGTDLCNKSGYQKWLPVKYMILLMSVVQELQEMKNNTLDNHAKKRTNGLLEIVDHARAMDASMIIRKSTQLFSSILV